MNRFFLKRLFVLLVIIPAFITIGYFVAGLDLSIKSEVVKKQPAAAIVSLAMSAKVDPNKLYEVTDVVDGDTFKVKIDGKEITVRMLGINTPEVVDERKPVECYGPEASAETKSLLKGREVKLVLNPKREKTDMYSRLLAFAYRNDGLFLNEYLIKEGFAREYTFGSSYLYQSQFKEAEKNAKTVKKGLWGMCYLALKNK